MCSCTHVHTHDNAHIPRISLQVWHNCGKFAFRTSWPLPELFNQSLQTSCTMTRGHGVTSYSSQFNDAVFRNASWRTVTRVCIFLRELINMGSVCLNPVEQGVMIRPTDWLLKAGQTDKNHSRPTDWLLKARQIDKIHSVSYSMPKSDGFQWTEQLQFFINPCQTTPVIGSVQDKSK